MLLYEIYKQFYTQYYNTNQAPICNSRIEKLIENFYKRIGKHVPVESIGDDFLESFIRFQWEYWIDKETKRKITLEWLIGKKAIERWLKVDNWEQQNYFMHKHTSNITIDIQSKEPNDYEDIQRKLYHNTDRGLVNCIENTTLYKKCITCLRCKFKTECKELLRKNYPILYKKRV